MNKHFENHNRLPDVPSHILNGPVRVLRSSGRFEDGWRVVSGVRTGFDGQPEVDAMTLLPDGSRLDRAFTLQELESWNPAPDSNAEAITEVIPRQNSTNPDTFYDEAPTVAIEYPRAPELGVAALRSPEQLPPEEASPFVEAAPELSSLVKSDEPARQPEFREELNSLRREFGPLFAANPAAAHFWKYPGAQSRISDNSSAEERGRVADERRQPEALSRAYEHNGSQDNPELDRAYREAGVGEVVASGPLTSDVVVGYQDVPTTITTLDKRGRLVKRPGTERRPITERKQAIMSDILVNGGDEPAVQISVQLLMNGLGIEGASKARVGVPLMFGVVWPESQASRLLAHMKDNPQSVRDFYELVLEQLPTHGDGELKPEDIYLDVPALRASSKITHIRFTDHAARYPIDPDELRELPPAA